MSLQFASLLDRNFAEYKAFEGLAIQVKNLSAQWDIEEKNYGYGKLRAKDFLTWKKILEEENHGCDKVSKNLSI